MGTIILSSLVSLDGRINGPDGGIGWHIVGPEVHQYFNDHAREVDTFLYGRRTYEGMAEFWPTAERAPDSTPEVIEYAKLARPKPKLAFSNTLESAGWNTEIVDGDHLAETVAELRARPGTKHLLYASADLAATFMRLDLIDEYWLFVTLTVADLADYPGPALIMVGDSDEEIPMEHTLTLREVLPDAQLAVLPGAGHGSLDARSVIDFLAGREEEI
jgi:dihydrofolate reductase